MPSNNRLRWAAEGRGLLGRGSPIRAKEFVREQAFILSLFDALATPRHVGCESRFAMKSVDAGDASDTILNPSPKQNGSLRHVDQIEITNCCANAMYFPYSWAVRSNKVLAVASVGSKKPISMLLNVP